ncbi:MAG: hypothetical protein ACOZBL_03840 [Patescibacteria group bacterium]
MSIRSFDMNGKLQARDVVTALLEIPSSSSHIGSVEFNHSSILCIADFILIHDQAIFCSNFLEFS